MPPVPPAPRRLDPSEQLFAWQHERRLLLLDEAGAAWTMAELRFVPEQCRYVEIRRATYRWPREAAGAILARGVANGPAAVDRLARALDVWVASHRAGSQPRGAE